MTPHLMGKGLQDIDTPALLVRRPILEQNLRRLQAVADKAGLELRPHIKAHKTPEIAQMQIRAGAVGVTAAKVGEAEVWLPRASKTSSSPMKSWGH